MSAVLAGVAPARDAVVEEWIRAATAYSRFAGPDGDGIDLLDGCALGHCRLAADGNVPNQPLTLDEQVWLSADVRLDDRAGLRAALRSRGRPAPPAAPDAELVLHAYLCWGEGFLERIAGDFAFALWDARRRLLLCVRDQIGVAPLHYAVCGHTLLVSSALDALLLHPDVSDRLDEQALADFLVAGRAIEFGATAYAEIRRLPPAHVLSWSDGRVQLRCYWRQPANAPLLRFSTPGEYVAHFGEVLELAVTDRTPAGPASVHLSGGMDSTTVAALAQRARQQAGDIRAVTGVLGGASGDEEGVYASIVADALQLPIDIVDESHLPPTDPFARPELRLPEPSQYRWTDLDVRIAYQALAYAGTCLSGLGADPLLMFRPGYWIDWTVAGHPLRAITALTDNWRLFRERPRPHLRSSLLGILSARRTPPPELPGWLSPDFARRIDAADRARASRQLIARTLGQRSLTEEPSWQTWLTWGDPSYSGVRLRTRHPFMDLRLLDFVARIPPYPWLVDKRILREATVGVLPEAVRRRPKTPLVDVPRRGTDEASLSLLAEFVRGVPKADEYIDRERLAEDLLAWNRTHDTRRNWSLSAPLGLVHWLAHTTVPRTE
ncbi:MAG TPA: asparagine synthase-related protein [Solirubrobacteraceae bacterium]|nr:asparagine synthase-related protein [Solirubrobacteraceae bacterium]